ncbi:hypothetical protein G3A56_15135 [Rhizobium oryzihabitans]|jgi:hypothetical protein|uniref:Antifreeze protein n=1 Tax=Rhizobium oryzihabitans TaxID=2267833 RepID=A0A7L5BK66_9HYPH|nr:MULTISPECIES: hypothetical protein [Rhizobium]EGP56452.1 hypothetical protein Agau_C200255 [Agrobacterium tumefaciens F2]MCW0981390.1 hypothetical protein [Agrobacterium sp. BT-220-3]QCM05461.1 hypothetical protein CFBP6626_09365 [Agrobacterium tumefaciens]CUX25650.1 conserved exported hypothetical protein [Agrobacterium genomosp. 5 str. CFBP 6626]HCD84511.1 hypothetical protein [Agrobacterium sp.]
MFSTFAKAGLAALIALGGISVTAPAASAGSDVQFRVQVQDGYGHGHRPGWGRPDRPRFGCSPRFAEEKASRMGLRRARVVDVSPRRVVVAGFDRHGRDRIVFANERGCPVIRR